MEEKQIIQLFYERSEKAIIELSNKYGYLCKNIAENILRNKQDSEECVNDAFLGVWNTIPPQKPTSLKAYVLKIVRNQAIKKYHSNTAIKRNSQYDVALDELHNCFRIVSSIECEVDEKELISFNPVSRDFLERMVSQFGLALYAKMYNDKEKYDLYKKHINKACPNNPYFRQLTK